MPSLTPDKVPPHVPVFTARQVADMLSITVGRVRTLAKERGVGKRLPGGRGKWLFTPADINALRVRRVGRPFKGANHHGWK